MNTKRLQILIDFMRKLPKSAEKKFAMRWWFQHNGDHKHRIGKYVTAKALTHCGTTACALGWAATIPALRRAGLKVEATTHHEAPLERAKEVFGLTDEQAMELFAPVFMDPPKTPKGWARHAERCMRNW